MKAQQQARYLNGTPAGAAGFPRRPRSRPAKRRSRRLAAALLAVMAGALAAGCGNPASAGQPAQQAAVTPACTTPGAPLGATALRAAYQAPQPGKGALTGAGTVIAVIIPSAAPRLAADLAAYSGRYGLPAPQLRVLGYGHVPAPSGADAAGWQQEGTLDLEMAHTLAPMARLLYLAVPPGSGALAEDAALSWLVTSYRVTVVSYSYGIAEDTADGPQAQQLIASSRAGLEAAARAGTTVVAAAGDYGPAEPGPTGQLERSVAWPASDPLATAVGGTRLTPVTTAGRTTYASTAASYATGPSGARAGGGGPSAVFARPAWQDTAAVTGPHRGVPDISMDASTCSPAEVYASVNVLPGRKPGWAYAAGTSIAAPLFAGVVADAAQAAGHPLGVLGPALYQLHGNDGITDVTAGSNTIPGLPGYTAMRGYDLATGAGTVSSIPAFSRALAAASTAPALLTATAGKETR